MRHTIREIHSVYQKLGARIFLIFSLDIFKKDVVLCVIAEIGNYGGQRENETNRKRNTAYS